MHSLREQVAPCSCLRGCCALDAIVALDSSHRAVDAKAQSDRAAARIRSLQAESDRLAAQARTVFGDLRTARDRSRDQAGRSSSRPSSELARVTADRDRAEKRLKALEATRIAQTPGDQGAARRAVEARTRRLRATAARRRTTCGRSDAWRAAWPRSPRSIGCASKRTAASWPPSATRSNELDQQARRWSKRCKRTRRSARAAVDAAVAARNRMIEDLDRRRDLAAQYVAELQQAQVRARAHDGDGRAPDRRSSRCRFAPSEAICRGRSPARSPRDSGASRQAVSAPPSSEMASRWRRPRGRPRRPCMKARSPMPRRSADSARW